MAMSDDLYLYNDGLLAGGRRPRLYLAKGLEARKFTGESLPGYCAVVTAEYRQSGKWSNTTYQLRLAPGVRPLHFVSPLHGTWGDKMESWGGVAQILGLPIELSQAIVLKEFPSTAERLDKVEAFALAVEEEHGNQAEVVVISFGSPTRRAIEEGFWRSPKSDCDSSATIAPGEGDDWSKPVVLEPAGAEVISSRHRPGMHGGYWAVEVVLPGQVAP
jgi:hypothetical protein